MRTITGTCIALVVLGLAGCSQPPPAAPASTPSASAVTPERANYPASFRLNFAAAASGRSDEQLLADADELLAPAVAGQPVTFSDIAAAFGARYGVAPGVGHTMAALAVGRLHPGLYDQG